MTNFHCRVRTGRKSVRLSQRHLTYLVGLRSQGVLSEIEAGSRTPGLGAALAIGLVLDIPVAELFPGLLAETERTILERVNELQRSNEIQDGTDEADFIAELVARLSVPLNLV